MEDEIDLRAYIEVLLRYWMWIVGLAVGAAVVAFVVSTLMPHTYEASAIVLVTQPRYQIQFDPRFGTVEQTPVYKALPNLATSDSVLQSVVDAYVPSDTSGIDLWTLETLHNMVGAVSEGDPSLVVLQVTSRSPQDAAAIANVWADKLAKHASAIYGQSEGDVTFFEAQVEQARAALDRAETALVDFQARNEASIVSAQLDSLRQAQTDYLADQRAITYIVQDIQGLRGQLAEQAAGQSVSLADSLTALFLQVKAFNAQDSAPIQLQVQSSADLSDKSTQEQIAFLDDLVATLQAKSTENDNRLAEVAPQMLALQEEIQKINVESDRLVRARDLARDTYMTLTRKLEEARISAQETNGLLQVGSYAATPKEPAGPHRLINTIIGGALGLFTGLALAVILEFARRYQLAAKN